MSNVLNSIATAGMTTLALAGVVATPAIAPIVSLVALPILACKVLVRSIEYKALYKETLCNNQRFKFGRVAEQDYTRWDGKAVAQISSSSQESLHELLGYYLHGKDDPSFERTIEQPADCPFSNEEDLKWLKKEFKRKEKKDLLNQDLKLLRAFAKALIPLAGLIWVILTETGVGGGSMLECTGCLMGGMESAEVHWSWKEAIQFRLKALEHKLQVVR